MNLGFYIILCAQFFSALADNALLFAAIALLKEQMAPAWHTPLLQEAFIIAYIILAPFVGSFADAIPKGRVMLLTNTIKFVGTLSMFLGLPPLYAYAIVGIGAAAYSPAKYGILTEYLPPEKLVVANSWMEGSTVAAIILGAVVGGVLVNPVIAAKFMLHLGVSSMSAAQFAIIIILIFYVLAAIFNVYIPRLPIDHKIPKKTFSFLLYDFWLAFKRLWKDPQGQVALAVTTLFWGAGATLRLVVITWALANLHFSLEKATQLTAMVAVGIAVGSIIAGKYIRLEQSAKVLPAGIAMGFIVATMIFVYDWRIALLLLFIVGALAGFFVVPLNALLQHRGHLLMGAGHSIAVQNFNENIGILVLIGFYTLMVKAEWHIHSIILMFGAFVSIVMSIIYQRYRQREREQLIRDAHSQ